jgi:hypothetical protein
LNRYLAEFDFRYNNRKASGDIPFDKPHSKPTVLEFAIFRALQIS